VGLFYFVKWIDEITFRANPAQQPVTSALVHLFPQIGQNLTVCVCAALSSVVVLSVDAVVLSAIITPYFRRDTVQSLLRDLMRTEPFLRQSEKQRLFLAPSVVPSLTAAASHARLRASISA
jgi:hypothetical protein